MRAILVTVFIITFCSAIYGQILVQENKIWNVVNCIGWGGCWTESFKINGDTIIDQVQYKKLLKTSDTTLTNWNFYGAIREVDHKVFLRYSFSDAEITLYDFSLSVGDTFSGFYYDCPVELTLQNIDTITLLNGEQRENYIFTNNEQWVKGIGSLNGLIYVGVYWCEADMYYELSCCFDLEEQLFQSDNYESCMVLTTRIEEEKNTIATNVFPNPFSDSAILKFNYSASQDYKLQIVNQHGQIVQTIDHITSGEVEIKRGELNIGVYLYRLRNDKEIIAKGKIIIK